MSTVILTVIRREFRCIFYDFLNDISATCMLLLLQRSFGFIPINLYRCANRWFVTCNLGLCSFLETFQVLHQSVCILIVIWEGFKQSQVGFVFFLDIIFANLIKMNYEFIFFYNSSFSEFFIKDWDFSAYTLDVLTCQSFHLFNYGSNFTWELLGCFLKSFLQIDFDF